MTRAEILSKRIELLRAQLREPEARDLEILTNRATKDGYGRSGALIMGRHERRMDTLLHLLAERIRLEKEQGLAPEDEATWHRDLVGSIHGFIDHHVGLLYEALEADSQQMLGRSSEPFVEEVKGQIKSLRDRYLFEADIMKGEREHQKRVPTPPSGPPSITLNFGDNAQIAGLNVAGVVGSIQATVNNLQNAGEGKIAEALKALTEAIAADASLSVEAKRESLAHVSAIGEELARPPEQRRPSVLRTVAGGLVGLIGHADKVYALYEILKTATRASGYELP